VCFNPYGVKLIDFKHVVRDIDRSHERSYEFICKWVMYRLNVDFETHALSL
jgi:hypothetical protein